MKQLYCLQAVKLKKIKEIRIRKSAYGHRGRVCVGQGRGRLTWGADQVLFLDLGSDYDVGFITSPSAVPVSVLAIRLQG